jgi:hypothetical protein
MRRLKIEIYENAEDDNGFPQKRVEVDIDMEINKYAVDNMSLMQHILDYLIANKITIKRRGVVDG